MKRVVLASQKGGVSKSTIVANLAVCSTQAGYRTAILDVDPQATALLWGRRREATSPIVLAHDSKGLHACLDELQRDAHDIVFLDTPGALNPLVKEALAVADLALVPSAPSVVDLEAALPTARALKELDTPFFYVVTQAPPSRARISDAEALLERLSARAGEPLHHRVDYQDAMARGLGVTEHRPFGAAASEIRALWAWLAAKFKLAERKS